MPASWGCVLRRIKAPARISWRAIQGSTMRRAGPRAPRTGKLMRKQLRGTAAGLGLMAAGAVVLVGVVPSGAGAATTWDHPSTSEESTSTSEEESTSTSEEETTSTVEETTSTSEEETTSTTEEETTSTTEESTSSTTEEPTTSTTTEGELPKTGSDIGPMAGVGAALLAAGAAVLGLTRRFRQS